MAFVFDPVARAKSLTDSFVIEAVPVIPLRLFATQAAVAPFVHFPDDAVE